MRCWQRRTVAPGSGRAANRTRKPGLTLRVASGRAGDARWLEIDYQVQETGYWCGPAATRIALSARTAAPSQGELAAQLGTTEAGTDHIGQVTGVLNARLGGGWYETKESPDPVNWFGTVNETQVLAGRREFREGLGAAGIGHEWHEVPGGHFVRPDLFQRDLDGIVARLRKA